MQLSHPLLVITMVLTIAFSFIWSLLGTVIVLCCRSWWRSRRLRHSDRPPPIPAHSRAPVPRDNLYATSPVYIWHGLLLVSTYKSVCMQKKRISYQLKYVKMGTKSSWKIYTSE